MGEGINEGNDKLTSIVRKEADNLSVKDDVLDNRFGWEVPPVKDGIPGAVARIVPPAKVYQKDGRVHIDGELSKSALIEALVKYKFSDSNAKLPNSNEWYNNFRVNGNRVTSTRVREDANVSDHNWSELLQTAEHIYHLNKLGHKEEGEVDFSKFNWNELIDIVEDVEFAGENGAYAQQLATDDNVKMKKPKKKRSQETSTPMAKTFDRIPDSSPALKFEDIDDELDSLMEDEPSQEAEPVQAVEQEQVYEQTVVQEEPAPEPQPVYEPAAQEPEAVPEEPIELTEADIVHDELEQKLEEPKVEELKPEEPKAIIAEEIYEPVTEPVEPISLSEDVLGPEQEQTPTEPLAMEDHNTQEYNVAELQRAFFAEGDTITSLAEAVKEIEEEKEDTQVDLKKQEAPAAEGGSMPRRGARFGAFTALTAFAAFSLSGGEIANDDIDPAAIFSNKKGEYTISLTLTPPEDGEEITEPEASHASLIPSLAAREEDIPITDDPEMQKREHIIPERIRNSYTPDHDADVAIATDENRRRATEGSMKVSPLVHKDTDDDIITAGPELTDAHKRAYARKIVRMAKRGYTLSKNKKYNSRRGLTNQRLVNKAVFTGSRRDNDRSNNYRRGKATPEQLDLANAWLLDYTGHGLDFFTQDRAGKFTADDIDFDNVGETGKNMLEWIVKKHKPGKQLVSKAAAKPKFRQKLPKRPKRVTVTRIKTGKTEKFRLQEEDGGYGHIVTHPLNFEEKRERAMVGLLQTIGREPDPHVPPAFAPPNGPKVLDNETQVKLSRLEKDHPDKIKEIQVMRDASRMAIGDNTCIGNYLKAELRTVEARCRYKLDNKQWNAEQLNEYISNNIQRLRNTCETYVNTKVPDKKNSNGESTRDILIKGNKEKLDHAEQDLRRMVGTSKEVALEQRIPEEPQEAGRSFRVEMSFEDNLDRIDSYIESEFDRKHDPNVPKAYAPPGGVNVLFKDVDMKIQDLKRKHPEKKDDLDKFRNDSWKKIWLHYNRPQKADASTTDTTTVAVDRSDLDFNTIVQARYARKRMSGQISSDFEMLRQLREYSIDNPTIDTVTDAYMKVQAVKQQEQKPEQSVTPQKQYTSEQKDIMATTLDEALDGSGGYQVSDVPTILKQMGIEAELTDAVHARAHVYKEKIMAKHRLNKAKKVA
jgi:hypothetical protein